MNRYHLNAKGEPGVCRAQPGNCPFGDESAHAELSGIKEARSWAEDRIAEEYGGIFGVSKSQAAILKNAGIIGFHNSSEHTEYRGKYYSYVALSLEGEEAPVYIPQDLKGNLVNDTAIWDFIEEIPQKPFESPEALSVLRDTFKSTSSWSV